MRYPCSEYAKREAEHKRLLSSIPTLAEARSRPLACPKHDVPLVVDRQEKKHERDRADEIFRAAVWARDKGRDRATGQPLAKQSPDSEKRGEVHHLGGRNVKPEWRTDPKRGVLLSAFHHELANTLGGKLLKIVGTDANKPLTFIRYDARGNELWRRIS